MSTFSFGAEAAVVPFEVAEQCLMFVGTLEMLPSWALLGRSWTGRRSSVATVRDSVVVQARYQSSAVQLEGICECPY